MSPNYAMILGVVLISSAAALGAVGTYIFKSGWENYQKVQGEYRGAERNIALEILEDTKSNPVEKTSTRIIKLRIKNRSEKELTNLRIVRTKADGPKDMERIPAPENLRIPAKLNPQDYLEFDLAGFREEPPSGKLGLHIGDEPLFSSLLFLFDSKTTVKYSFFATAAESLSAEITVEIWVEDGKLHYK